MKIKLSLSILCLVLLGCGGCASGVKYSDMADTISPVPTNQGRIFFYRASIVGGAIQPAIRLNGEKIGIAKPKGFFYVDRPAGTYKVSASTEAKRSLSLNLEAGEERYVRLEIKIGLIVGHIKPVLVDTVVGQKQIKKTKYIGQ